MGALTVRRYTFFIFSYCLNKLTITIYVARLLLLINDTKNNTTRDHHNREARVFRRQPFCSTVSRIHRRMHSPRLRMCPTSSPCPARVVKRDLRSISVPLYPCFLFFIFSLSICNHLAATEICFLFSSRVSRLSTLVTLSLLSASLALPLSVTLSGPLSVFVLLSE